MNSEFPALRISGWGWRRSPRRRGRAEMRALSRAENLLSVVEQTGDDEKVVVGTTSHHDEGGGNESQVARLVVDKRMAVAISEKLFRNAATMGLQSPEIRIHEAMASIDVGHGMEDWLMQRIALEIERSGPEGEGRGSHVGVITNVADAVASVDLGRNKIVTLPLHWISRIVSESGLGEVQQPDAGQFIVLAMDGESITGVEALLVAKPEPRIRRHHPVQGDELSMDTTVGGDGLEEHPGAIAQ